MKTSSISSEKSAPGSEDSEGIVKAAVKVLRGSACSNYVVFVLAFLSCMSW